MKEKAQAPELRFDGFTDDWEERKLSSMTDYKNGKGHEDKQSTFGKLELINLNSISISGGLKHSGKFIDEANDTLQKDDLVMILSDVGHGDLLGRVALIPEDNRFVLNQRVALLRPNATADPQFLFSYINAHQYYFKAQGAGMSQLNISKGSVENFISFVPIIEEQKKIGSFFKQLDETIALHQRKLDLLKEQKKGYLQKMFPKNGAKVPELRFAGFADDWEERKFKDIIEKLTGGASIKPSDYLEEGIRTIPKGAVNSTGLADLSGSKYISEEFYESNKSSHVSTNNLVTSLRDLVPSAPNMGRIVRIAGEDEDFLMPQGVYKLELFDGMDEEFLIAFSNSDKYRKIISSEKNGSTQVHIRNGEFLNIDIELPFSEEQKQIGSFFKQLDNSIALHQRKLYLLKEQKKGFLQKMFV